MKLNGSSSVWLVRLAVTVLTVAALLLPSVAATADTPTGPISTSAIERQAGSPRSIAPAYMQKCMTLVGVDSYDTSSAKLVKYADAAPFGASAAGTGWLVLAEIELSDVGGTARRPINVLIDEPTGRVIAAYTDVHDGWVSSVLPSRDIEDIVDENGWDMGAEIPDDMQSSAIDAVREALRLEGFDPTNVGQVIARPRWITPRFPARLVDGVLEPIRSTQKVWVVQVCGTKTREVWTREGEQYYSGKVVQLIDGSLEFAWAFYVP